MAGFYDSEAFSPHAEELRLLPFTFERLGDDRFIVGNALGDMTVMSGLELRRVADLDLHPGDDLYERAFEKLLISRVGQRSQLQLLAMRLRSRMSFLRATTPLHIFVVTLRCEHSCPYCQVSRQSADRDRYDMTEETALRGLEVAFSAPAPLIKIEFQGGEPLLNFGLIKYIVQQAKIKSACLQKSVQFVITSNFAMLSNEVLVFCKEHSILLSTSLDGPSYLHNKNRPRPGNNSYELAIDGIRRAQAALGIDRVGALMTTTAASLGCVEEIVQEYIALGLDGIFLRPLSPYGFAIKTKQFERYNGSDWLNFYERGLRYILDINKRGANFPEFYAALLLRRMLTDKPTGYVDLRSPAGIGLGALVYNYDGKVFASDEGRMLAEMGDRTFELGDLNSDTYRSIILSDKLTSLIAASLTQCVPQCCSCVFETHCGADPVYHYATQADPVGIKPLSEFCSRQKGIFKLLVDILENSPEDAAVLRRWAK